MLLKNRSGFSYIELLTVVVVIGIMAAIAVPNFLNWQPNMRLKVAARDLYAATMKARGEAVKQNKQTALVFNQTIGATTYAYIAYADTNTNFQYDAADDPIFVQVQQWPKDVFVDAAQGGGDGFTFSNDNVGNPAIFFKSNAIPTKVGGGGGTGSAFLTNSNGRKLNVAVSRAGNISIN